MALAELIYVYLLQFSWDIQITHIGIFMIELKKWCRFESRKGSIISHFIEYVFEILCQILHRFVVFRPSPSNILIKEYFPFDVIH